MHSPHWSPHLVFWAMLKWEEEADKPYAGRWIILIAYIMGLGLGIHRLNLLVLPALVFVFYFKKYEVTTKGFDKDYYSCCSDIMVACLCFITGCAKNCRLV